MATANVKRYIIKDVDSRDYKYAFTVETGKVFILSGIWTSAVNSVKMKIITSTGEEVMVADSIDETNRAFRGLVLDSQDEVFVRVETTDIKEDLIISGELFDKA